MRVQKRLSAQVLNCGENRVRFDDSRLDEIKEAITKTDIRSLVAKGVITARPLNNTSRFWARKIAIQKSLGKRKGQGSRKGKKTARGLDSKRIWINKIRLQRGYLKELRSGQQLGTKDYHDLYMKSKGGFFRSLRHLKLYTEEKGFVKK